MTGLDFAATGLTLARMGLDGIAPDALVRFVEDGA